MTEVPICAGPAAALLILAINRNVSIPIAVACLVIAAGLQACAYAGFHAYVQDVASQVQFNDSHMKSVSGSNVHKSAKAAGLATQDAGRMLGLTNTGGTVVGVACNIMTGRLAATPGGFSAVFAITTAVYFSSFVMWNTFMKGEPVRLT